MDSPWIYVAALAVIPFFYRMCWQDYKAQASGETLPNALPGMTPVAVWVSLFSMLGVLVILGIEIAGEYRLGIVEKQSEMTIVFALVTVFVAPLIEEVIFRGFLCFDKTKAALLASIVGGSVLFALLHAHIITFETPDEDKLATSVELFGGMWLQYGNGALLTTSILFVRSLWLYAVRFMPGNARHSIIPCVLAHMISNVGVVVAKGFQGKLSFAWDVAEPAAEAAALLGRLIG